MENFSIIQALCRASLAAGSAAARRQVERLRDAVRAAGDETAARSLDQMLIQATRATEMAPSKLTQSKGLFTVGEELSRNTALPVDKETSAPLADIYFPDSLPSSMPFLDEQLERAARTLVVEWQSSDTLKSIGVEPANTCLIYGPPGTGKTTLALWMAHMLNVPAVVVRLDGLISSFLGTTARNVGNLFTFVNRYRCVLVLDEFDAIAKIRDDPHEVGEIKRVVNALLQNIDVRKKIGITVAVTNHERLLDAAIWRRFEIQLAVPRPTLDGRIAIAMRYLPPLELSLPALRFLAWITEGLSGAEIEGFINGLKKFLVLNNFDEEKLLPALQHLVVLNGSRLQPDRVKMLELEPQDLAQQLLKNNEFGLTRADVGQLLHKDKATISRWLKSN